MLVSLFTDASHCPQTLVGGWGAWGKCELGTVEGGGPMKRDIPNSTVAEARAIYGGLLLVSQAPWWGMVTNILVQSDNMTAVESLNRNAAHVDHVEWRGNFTDAIKDFKYEHSIKIRGRWIKGHQPSSKAPRNWVNNRTDTLAKAGLKKARAWHHEGRK